MSRTVEPRPDAAAPETPRPPAPQRRPVARSTRFAVVGAIGFVLGGASGIAGTAATRPVAVMAPAIPVAIHDLRAHRIATIRGTVSERFGNDLVLADATGHALVDLGPAGSAAVSHPGDALTVQGRLDRGVFHAAFLVGADNTVQALGPLAAPPPPPGPPPPPPGTAARLPPPGPIDGDPTAAVPTPPPPPGAPG